MKRRIVWVWVVLGLVVEKILQHGLSALFFVVSVDGIGRPDVGRIPLSDPAMAVLNLVVMGFFVLGFWDIWKYRVKGLYLVIVFSLFDVVAEFVFHGFGFLTVSVVVALFLICLAFALKSIGLEAS
jgi:hypothetical protein